MLNHALKLLPFALLLLCGCSSNAAKNVGGFVGRSVLNSAIDAPVRQPGAVHNADASDAVDGLNEVRKSGEKREHAENVDELSDEYREFLREQNETPEQGDEQRSIMFEESDRNP